jgi:hypothetical protein
MTFNHSAFGNHIATQFLIKPLSSGLVCFIVTLSAAGIIAKLTEGNRHPVFVAQDSKASTQQPAEAGFVPLFDGTSFQGWEGNRDWFRIEDGCVVAGNLAKQIPHNEFLCTEAKYGDFELKFEVRLKGKGDNAGVQFRSVRVPDKTEVSGFQCDVGNAWDRPVWGSLYDESRRNKMMAEGKKEEVLSVLKQGDWNEMRIRAQGDRIQIWLNGKPTVDYTESDATIPKTGVIGLQIHSGPPTEAWYRNLSIKPL